jgi:HEPN pEK499 p136
MTLPTDRREVLNRTMVNLRFIKEHQRAGDTVFEVTQLVNSFLAALVSPWSENESFWNISVADAEKAGWPHISSDDPSLFQPRTLGELIKEMRNALAHGNIAFNGKSDIEDMTLSTFHPPAFKDQKWRVTIAVSDLEKMLERFAAAAA